MAYFFFPHLHFPASSVVLSERPRALGSRRSTQFRAANGRFAPRPQTLEVFDYFFDLPLEIRFQIYEYLLLTEGVLYPRAFNPGRVRTKRQPQSSYELEVCARIFRTGRHVQGQIRNTAPFKQPDVDIALLQTCKRMWVEASGIFYGKNTFALVIIPYTRKVDHLIEWDAGSNLSALRPSTWNMVRHLHIVTMGEPVGVSWAPNWNAVTNYDQTYAAVSRKNMDLILDVTRQAQTMQLSTLKLEYVYQAFLLNRHGLPKRLRYKYREADEREMLFVYGLMKVSKEVTLINWSFQYLVYFSWVMYREHLAIGRTPPAVKTQCFEG
ncbi:MAG: hypothetical protein M1833_001437 [Piccolia ochrophora]|nr:MAG: hypothetical protein M1833_001437 [Piccolia ochrophora]